MYNHRYYYLLIIVNCCNWLAHSTFLPNRLSDEFGHLLHITDPHIDTDYSPGSPNKCVLGSSGMGCCRTYDIPIAGHRPSSKWGEKTCDAPPHLLNETLSWIRTNLTYTFDAILYGGDSVGHHDITQGYQKNIRTASITTGMFQTHFPNTLLIPNQGNHDTYPIDQVLPIIGAKFRSHLADTWQSNIGDSAAHLFATEGYYSVPLNEHVTIVSMASLLYDSHNLFKIKSDATDSQVLWLEKLVNHARQDGRHLLLLGHIFPAGGESTSSFNKWLSSVLQSNQDVLHNGIFGHSHNDEWTIMPPNLTGANQPPATALVTPSMMPDQRNPSFRIYKYRRVTGELLDYHQYYIDLHETVVQDRIQIKSDYSFQAEYKQPDLSGESMWSLYQTMRSHPEVADAYCRHYWGTGNTTGKCDVSEVSQLLTNQIVTLSPGSPD